jgi:hypothetical protein
MSKLQVPEVIRLADKAVTVKRPWLRILTLCSLFSLSVFTYLLLIGAAPESDDRIAPFLHVWMISFLPYFAACAFVLATKPLSGTGRRVEIGIIVCGALILRVMLLPLPPGLSHDSWRYVWDARVTLHGFSPYVYAPGARVLAALQNTILYTNSRFRNVPTIYPPGAQAVFLLSYLLAPANLYFLKGLFVLFDMGTCIALIVLLGRKRLDQRRVILYAWCPLPIVEFAIQGHVDVITLTFTMLAILAASYHNVRGYILTGFLIGLATLTKLYPILLLVVILPEGDDRDTPTMQRIRRHYIPLLGSCFATIIIGYLPYLILGHGQAFGFFAAYASEQGQNAGVTQQIVHWWGDRLHVPLTKTITLEHLIAVFMMCAASAIVFALRWRNRIRIEAGTLILFGAVLSISSHVFPWYTTILLLFVPVLLINPPTLVGTKGRVGLYGRQLAIIAVWYFTSTALLSYFFNAVQGVPDDWTLYYRLVYWPVTLALCIAALIGFINFLRYQKRV